MIPSDKKSLVYALLAVLCWSTVATAFKLALDQQSRFQLLLSANLVSVFVLAAVLAAQQKLIPALTQWRSWRTACASAAINPAIYYLILFQAYELLPAQVAQPINYTWAITLSLGALVVLRQRLVWRDLLGILLGYAGVVVISVAGWQAGLDVPLFGVGLALLSTLLWAGYWLLNARDSREPVQGLLQNFLLALPLTGAAWRIFDGHWVAESRALLSAAYVGVFEMGIAFLFWLLALKHAKRASSVAGLIFISPFLSLFFIHTMLGEPVGWLTIVGLGLLVLGLLLKQSTSKL
ncbi:DMT family transporter [Teredinibacter turnerae]|uniref:DMT family transporter n=1 Tax=Teredinibacter turnerae TaxID=2426 RepID=UPI0030CFA1A5